MTAEEAINVVKTLDADTIAARLERFANARHTHSDAGTNP